MAIANTRPGCPYCFRTLDPGDPQENLRPIMKCTRCEQLYHQECWEKSGCCLVCKNSEAQVTTIDAPLALAVTPRRRAIPLNSPAVAYGSTQQKRIDLFVASLDGWMLVFLLLALSIWISMLGFQILPISRGPSVPRMVLIAALISSTMTAIVWYEFRRLPDSKTLTIQALGSRLLTRLLIGSLVAVVADSIIFLQFLRPAGGLNPGTIPFVGIVYGHLAALALTLVVLWLYRPLITRFPMLNSGIEYTFFLIKLAIGFVLGVGILIGLLA